MRKYNFLEYFLRAFRVGRNTRKCFDPFGHVVHSHQDVFALLRHWERTHEVNSLDIEDIHLKIALQGHYISGIDIPVFLASWTTLHEFLCISIHVWPKEFTLPNFCMGLEGSVMSSIG